MTVAATITIDHSTPTTTYQSASQLDRRTSGPNHHPNAPRTENGTSRSSLGRRIAHGDSVALRHVTSGAPRADPTGTIVGAHAALRRVSASERRSMRRTISAEITTHPASTTPAAAGIAAEAKTRPISTASALSNEDMMASLPR